MNSRWPRPWENMEWCFSPVFHLSKHCWHELRSIVRHVYYLPLLCVKFQVKKSDVSTNTANFSTAKWHKRPLGKSECPSHRSSTPKFVTPTALSCTDNSWRSTTLSSPKKLTSSTANLEWCHVYFIRDSYSTFIRRVIGPSKNSMELFCKAKFDFKSTWNRDSATSHHKHPVCQSPAGDAEKLTNVWSRCFGTNRIIDNWHRCLGVMWRKRKNYFDK